MPDSYYVAHKVPLNYNTSLKFHSVSLAQALKERRIDLKDAEQILRHLK